MMPDDYYVLIKTSARLDLAMDLLKVAKESTIFGPFPGLDCSLPSGTLAALAEWQRIIDGQIEEAERELNEQGN